MKKGWEIKTLGDICFVIAGQFPQSTFYNSNAQGLPFYQGKKEFQKKYIAFPTTWTTKVTKEAYKSDIELPNEHFSSNRNSRLIEINEWRQSEINKLLSRKLRLFDELKKSILHKAFNGEL
ncbi:MAG: hypothetical protein K8S56_05540 [Candidatus Cloacimonetes bacterium]|nr:hypothetical protein [Candidatus Cloacimonadota bacterium]